MMSQSPVSSRQANYALGVLLSAYILSFIDRNVMAILVGPIRAQFAISDFQFSILHGWAFTICYAAFGLPMGWLADRFSRRGIILGGVLTWSIMTCLCGFSKSFSALFSARLGVGLGEATLSPAAYSLLSDHFPPNRLRWATSTFAMGIPLGTGASYMLGGWLYDWFNRSQPFPSISPWQATFIAVGLPGFIIILFLLGTREPARRQLASETPHAASMRELLNVLKNQWQVYASLMIGLSMMSIVGYGTMAWLPEFLFRNHGIPKRQAGAILGSIFMMGGALGTFAGAGAATLLQRMGYRDANMRLVMLVAIALIVPAVGAPLLPTSSAVFAAFAIIIFLHYSHFGVAMAALQLVTPNRMRGQVSAMLLFFSNSLGLGLGGTTVAVFTDFIFHDDYAVKYSLALTAAICYPLTAGIIAAGLRYYRRALHD